MRHYWFPIWKRGIFSPGKKIKELRGDVHWYAAQASPKIDAARAEKDRFRMETTYLPFNDLQELPSLNVAKCPFKSKKSRVAKYII
jgi:hypothetical protein